ncbi:MAG: hypothetical protein V1647_03080 [Pseudomonadota bacterium]
MAKIKFLVIIFVFSSILFAQPNQDIDLRNEFGPIRNQGHINFCYAFATADLLSYWLNNSAGFKNKGIKWDTRIKENMVSAFAYALSYNRLYYNRFSTKDKFKSINLRNEANRLEKELEKARTKILTTNIDAINISKKLKDLDELDPNDEQKWTLTDELNRILERNNNYAELLSSYKLVIWHLSSILEEPAGGDLNDDTDLSSISICFEKEVNSDEAFPYTTKSEITGFEYTGVCPQYDFIKKVKAKCMNPKSNENDKTISQLVDGIFCKIKKSSKERIYNAMSKKNVFDPTLKFLKKTCLLNRKLGKYAPKIKIIYFCDGCTDFGIVDPVTHKNTPVTAVYSQQAIFDIIDTQLQNKNPVYIGIDDRVFKYPTSDWVNDGTNHNHASLIVGRLKNNQTNKIEYIIRGTTGASSCEASKAAYIEIPEHILANLKQEFKTDVITNCPCSADGSGNISTECIDDKYYKLEKKVTEMGEQRVKTIHTPFRCELGYYIIERDAFGDRTLQEVSYFETKKDAKIYWKN